MPSPAPEEFGVQLYGHDRSVKQRLGAVGDSLKCIDGDIVWDAITPTFNATSDVYQFYLGGVLQKTITIKYTDVTKEVMSGITKV